MSKNRLDYTANLSRHSHDVTAGYTASIAPSMIVPQYFDILQPNDTIYYKTHMFVRSQDLVTAFLGEVDLHIKYFFVPLQMLYTNFGQVFAQTNDVISSFYKSATANESFPVGSFNSFFTQSKVTNWMQNRYINGVGDVQLKGAFRLLDALDVNPCVTIRSFQYKLSDQGAPTSEANPFYNLYVPNGSYFAFLAYQAIYQKKFRNDEFERFDIESYNIDDCFQTGNLNESHMNKLLQLRYCGRMQDYFTSVRPSPVASAVNMYASSAVPGTISSDGGNTLPNIYHALHDYLSPTEEYRQAQGIGEAIGSGSQHNIMLNGITQGYQPSDDEYSYFNAQAIRSIFALDKYLRIYGRAGKTYDEQILAHFGVKIPHDVKHDLTELKHYRLVLQSDPVVATADTESGALGQIGGNLQGQLDTNEEKFTAPVHGVFMAVAFVLTKPRYFGTCSKLHAISNRNQFPYPEFDNLGAQPMYYYECGWNNTSPSDMFMWQNRYSEFKQKYNRCSFNYAHGYNENANFYAPWVVSRYALSPLGNGYAPSTTTTFAPSLIFEPVNALNNVMAVEYNSGWSYQFINNPHLVNQTDPLLTEFCCFAKKVSWMSPTGEPNL